MNYVPLNIKTNYELLSSLIKIDDLISYAKKNNFTALGITDSNMFSCKEFYNKCIINNIKPIIGIDLIIHNKKVLIYAKNYEGYQSLCKIVSIKNIEEKVDINKKDTDNLIAVCNYNDIEEIKSLFNTVYIKYQSLEEKNKALSITDNIVYINEIKMFKKEDSEYLKYLYMIKDGKTISDSIDYNFNDNCFLELKEEEKENTINFSNLINIEFPKYDFDLPVYCEDSEKTLYNLVKKGLYKRLNKKVTKEYSDRLFYELDVIKKMGYTDYFLIVYDFILYAKKNNILIGPGRGSAAGSLVCYSLGITEVDPLKYDLIFERFLNPDRISMPDIDVDIDDTKREDVINYVKNKYGNYKVANIITFGTLLPKQVIRDVSKIMEIPTSEVDKIINFIGDKDSFKDLELKKEFTSFIERDKEYSNLIRICKRLEGLKRHSSIHAAGVVMSNNDLFKKIPLYKSGNTILSGYTMEYLEELGLLKMDFLGLKNLSIISEVLSLIKEDKKEINLNLIPLDDKKTISIFNEVNTVGIFQFESAGMKSFLKEYKISSFNDIVNAIALYRPGPREMIPHFIKRKSGLEKVSFITSSLENILKNTYGIIIFQEQIMEILRVVGGYSYAQADVIRRAMSKKKEDIISKEKEKFILGSMKNGYTKEIGNTIYNLVYKFSNYGFNKSHSVAYSLVAYYLAYLKANYPQYFIINLLNNVIGREIKTKEYIDEAKYLNLSFGRLDINFSENKYVFYNNKIIFPFGIVKNIGIAATQELLKERSKGIYKSFYDFMIRSYKGAITKRVVINLIELGAFDMFELNKRKYIESLDKIIEYILIKREVDSDLVLEPVLDDVKDYTDAMLMEKEYKLLGFYLSNHPSSKYNHPNILKLKNVSSYFNKVVNIVVLIENIKVIKTKKNEDMAFIDISDDTAKISGVIFTRLLKENYDIKAGNLINIKGRIEKRNADYQIVCDRIKKINI